MNTYIIKCLPITKEIKVSHSYKEEGWCLKRILEGYLD